jgi:hypothetical protein
MRTMNQGDQVRKDAADREDMVAWKQSLSQSRNPAYSVAIEEVEVEVEDMEDMILKRTKMLLL